MKNALFIGFAAAGLIAGTAFAHGDQAKSSQTSSTQTGTSASASQESTLAGKITSIDKQNKSVTIASDSGTQQQVKIGDSTNVTRDGTSSSFSQLQSGDQVRASFDPSTKQATTLDVQTKIKKQ